MLFAKRASKSDRSLALHQKTSLERFAPSLFANRAKKSNLLFCSLLKERKRTNRSFALLKNITKSKSLFCSFKESDKEQIALYKKSNKEQFSLLLFSERAKKNNSLFCSLPKEQKSKHKEQIALFLIFCSFYRANRSFFALF